MLGELLYETADIAYDTVAKQYVNPKDNSVYGPNPPAGGWLVSWYADSSTNNTPVIVNQTPQVQSVQQIQQQLAQQQTAVNTTNTTTATTTTGISPLVWVGIGLAAMFLLKGAH